MSDCINRDLDDKKEDNSFWCDEYEDYVTSKYCIGCRKYQED